MSSISAINLLKLFLLGVLISYIGLMCYAALVSNKRIFPAPPSGYSDTSDIIKFPYNDQGQAVSMVYLDNPDSRFLIFYNHGNGEDLQSILPRLRYLHKSGYSVLAWDYPGYGTSDGSPTEKLVLDIADRIWKTIPETYRFHHEDVILYGRSLGGGPSTWLAARYPCAGLVLEGAFTSIFRIGLGIGNIRILPWDIFNNLGLIGRAKCPVLVIHGTEDEVVPFPHGTALYEAAASPKFFAWIDGGGHSDVVDMYSDVYYSSLQKFSDFISRKR